MQRYRRYGRYNRRKLYRKRFVVDRVSRFHRNNVMTIPFACDVVENSSQTFSFNSLFELKDGSAGQGLFYEVPWKCIYVKFAASRDNGLNEPAVLQSRLHSSEVSDFTSTIRRLVIPGNITEVFQRFALPNEWKSESDKDSPLIVFDNCQLGSGKLPTKIVILGTATFLISNVPFDAPKESLVNKHIIKSSDNDVSN